MTVNSISTDSSSYPAHATPTTGNTFKLGSFDFGYDPETVEENYERQTTTTDRLQGISQSVDNAGLVTKVTIDGNTDGGGLTALWDKARNNELSYLDAEFQNGWALIADLSVQNNENAPDYLTGLFRYSLDVLIVSDPTGGIGDVSSFIDHGVKDTGTYVSDEDAGDADFEDLEFTVDAGSGSINDSYVSWDTTTLTVNDDATNWVYVSDDNGDGSGDVKYNNSGFPSDSINLYRVHTSGGEIVKVEDVRASLIGDNDSEPADFTHNFPYGKVTFGTGDTDGGTSVSWPTTSVLLVYNSTNWIFSDNTGEVQVNQSGFPADVVPMWEVDTDDTGVANLIDHRPDDLSGSSDTSNSDLVFSDDLIVDDSAFEFARILALTDTVDLSDAPPGWLGIVSLSDSISDIDDTALLPALGIASLSDSLDVLDGGTASGGGGGGGDPDLTTDVALNGGTVDVTVYEDTTGDGSANNQESVSVADGTNTYTLSNLNGGQGNDYWVGVTLDDADITSSPTVNSLSLDVPSGNEPDQNPNTEWTIFGGQYDTSGNEYEGGGVVTKYEQ